MVALTNINGNPKLTRHLVEKKLIHMNVLDIGARDGFAHYWGYYEDCLEIVGFDPDKQQARLLGGRCKAMALSGDSEERIFYVIRYPGSSGFFPPNVEFANRLQNRDYLNIIDTVEIQTVSLDSLNLKPDFLKLDTEGSELEILQGGQRTLKSALGISVEVGFVELFKGQPLFREVDSFLSNQGFALYDLTTSRLARWQPGKTGMSNGNQGQVIVGQVLYFRDIYPTLDGYNLETVLKMASLFEVFNLTDCAFELLAKAEAKEYLEILNG